MGGIEYRHSAESYEFRLAARSLVIAAIALLFAVLIAASVFWLLGIRQISFDSKRWLTGDHHVQFRMKDSLLNDLATNKYPNRSTIDRILGTDDDRNRNPNWHTYEIEDWDGNPWDVNIKFDDQGNLKSFDATVQ